MTKGVSLVALPFGRLKGRGRSRQHHLPADRRLRAPPLAPRRQDRAHSDRTDGQPPDAHTAHGGVPRQGPRAVHPATPEP